MVQQGDINAQLNLQVYHTGARGWGVRTLTRIKKGQYIAEYVGEALEDNVVDDCRKGKDIYIFNASMEPSQKGSILQKTPSTFRKSFTLDSSKVSAGFVGSVY